MSNNTTSHDTIVAAIATGECEQVIKRYADMLAGQHNKRIRTFQRMGPALQTEGECDQKGSLDAFVEGMRRLAQEDKIGMIVSDWSTIPFQVEALLRLADELSVPAVFVRHRGLVPIERVVVATAGGPNVLELMWIANEIAATFRVPVRILHYRQAKSADVLDGNEQEPAPLEDLSVRLLGMRAGIETIEGSDFTQSIADYVSDKDLLVMGAPSPLRRTMAFVNSVPEIVARTLTSPLVLLSSPPPRSVSLRGLLWGGLIKTGLRASNRQDAISSLIQNLVLHNQLPRSSQGDILERALGRETIMSTAVGGGTAFPHVKIPGFFGLAVALAICPEGVAFDSADGQLTRFIYLMVTPDGLCEDYLTTLGSIAKRMREAGVRESLLLCDTPTQVLDILEPQKS